MMFTRSVIRTSNIIRDHPGETRDVLEGLQSELGDSLKDDLSLGMVRKMQFQKQAPSALVEFWEAQSNESRKRFGRTYGHVGHLLTIKVPVTLLQAAVHYWDPAYRCFTFNSVDLSPLMEEYGELIGYDPHVNKIYNPGEVIDGRKIVHRLLQIEQTRTPGKDKGVMWVFPIDKLMDFSQDRFETPEGQMAFALAVYGAVLFPCAGGYVEKNVIKLVHLVKYGTNPIPAILCETIRSLNYCRIHGEGSFRGCSQLLGLWLVSHLKVPERIGAPIVVFEDHTRLLRDPIQNFKAANMKSTIPTIDVWRSFLEELEPDMTFARAVWYKPKGILYKCGSYNWVPLMGPWGGTSQAPAMFFRQGASNLCIPVTHGLRELEFSHQDVNGKLLSRQVMEAWKRIHVIERGSFTVDLKGKDRYAKWLRERKKTVTVYSSFGSLKRKRRMTDEKEFVEKYVQSKADNEEIDAPVDKEIEVGRSVWEVKYRKYKNKCKRLKRKIQEEREGREVEKKQFDMLKKKFLKMRDKNNVRNDKAQAELQEVQKCIQELNEELLSWKEDAYQLQLQMHVDRDKQMRVVEEKDGLIEQMNEENQQLTREIMTLEEQNGDIHSMLNETQQEHENVKFKVRVMMSRLMILADWAAGYERRLSKLSSIPVLEMPELFETWAFLKDLKEDLQELQRRLDAVQAGNSFVVEIPIVQVD